MDVQTPYCATKHLSHQPKSQSPSLTIQHRADEGLGVLVDLLLGAADAEDTVVLELLAPAAARVVERQVTILPELRAACIASGTVRTGALEQIQLPLRSILHRMPAM